MVPSIIPCWKEAPFLRLLPPFVAGILLAGYVPVSTVDAGTLLAWCIGTVLWLSSLRMSLQFRLSMASGVLLQAALLILGVLLTTMQDTSDRPVIVAQAAAPDATVTVRLKEPPSERPKSFKALAEVVSIVHAGRSVRPQTDVLLYFSKAGGLSPPPFGTELTFARSLERVVDRPGQGASGYARYCALQNIYFQVFLRAGDYRVLPSAADNRLDALLFAIRRTVVEVLRSFVPGKKECGLAEALLIGYRDDLDRNLVQAYSNTGVVHVVAISGLHLGLIFAILKTFCRPFERSRGGRVLSAAFIIVGLWLFGFVAGGSPSVMRSAVMFSFLVAGRLFNRRSSGWNSLAASAFCLLSYHPVWLFDVGFQLSYGALAGIMLYAKPLTALMTLRNPMLHGLWKMIAVTLAAQPLTAPVCVFYFHQFPTCFVLTNLVAVPLSSLILVTEIIVCLLSPFTAVAQALGCLAAWMLRCMNAAVEFSSALPFSQIAGLELTITGLLTMYVFILLLSAWWLLRRRLALPGALIAAILFMVMRLV